MGLQKCIQPFRCLQRMRVERKVQRSRARSNAVFFCHLLEKPVQLGHGLNSRFFHWHKNLWFAEVMRVLWLCLARRSKKKNQENPLHKWRAWRVSFTAFQLRVRVLLLSMGKLANPPFGRWTSPCSFLLIEPPPMAHFPHLYILPPPSSPHHSEPHHHHIWFSSVEEVI